jgi:acyl-CoA reductase-like NAD-dependent aldehyde dehydrogenase
MKPVILLIDLQNDFLRSPSLEPAAGQIVERTARLVEGARTQSLPVIHVWTTVNREHDQRMPHWKSADRWICEANTLGHEPPPPLCPRKSEPIVHKTFFSAFSNDDLDRVLHSLQADTLILAGVHLHGCVRSTALDAYQRGFTVWIAGDAVGSDDPLHGSISRRWLAARAARFLSVESCLAMTSSRLRTKAKRQLEFSPQREATEKEISKAVTIARKAGLKWRATPMAVRSQVLLRLADALAADQRNLARTIAREIHKPITLAAGEITRSVALLKAVAARADEPLETRCAESSIRRHRPLGVVAMITPWNNPVAIPLGKIAPALLYGNSVVWKPAPAGSSLAIKIMEQLHAVNCPAGLVNLICGGRSTALSLMSHSGIDAVTITGSPAAGYSAQDVCGSRHIPLQAELGGNNAAIVWLDADLQKAAADISDAAFAFAGQRCTANRRVIVHARVYDKFLNLLQKATAGLVCGDPLNPRTRVGPLISKEKAFEITSLLDRIRVAGAKILNPHKTKPSGACFPPTIVCCDGFAQEIFQEETFGPILVVAKARDWNHAMRLCNDVRQGLVASLFSTSGKLQKQFLNTAEAGILKINLATADADAEAPFGGWKASGIGPPEHGDSNREFYTRAQAVYQ